MQKLAVTVMMDSACIPADDPDFRRTNHDGATERHVVNALRRLGHTIRILGVGDDVGAIVSALTEQRPDVVFNLTEQFRDERHLDRNVAGLLELIDLPFTGAGSLGLTLCRNKALCKQLLHSQHIRVPDFAMFPPGVTSMPRRQLKFPLVVKPLMEDGSDGISNASLVKDGEELQARAQMVHERFNQAAIAEEYIEGRELYVSIIGNDRLTILPMRELFFGERDNGGPVLATYRVKWDKEYQEKWSVRFGFAELDAATTGAVARICRKAYQTLGMRDYGRIDVRLSADNEVVILEGNPNPNIGRDDEVAMSAAKAGVGYAALLNRILRMALRRHAQQHPRSDS